MRTTQFYSVSVFESLTQRRGIMFPSILSRELTKPQQSRLTYKTSTTYPVINLVWVPWFINISPTQPQNCSYQVMPDRTWTASKGTANKEQTNNTKNRKNQHTFNECKSTVFSLVGKGDTAIYGPHRYVLLWRLDRIHKSVRLGLE